MFCPNCGENLPDGSKFCGSCGANLTELISDVMTRPEGDGGSSAMAQGGPASVDLQPVPSKRKGSKKLIAVVAAAAAVVVVIAALGFKVFSSFSGKKDHAYIYFSDGKYELLTNVKKGESIEVASSRAEYASNFLLAFSPDGKYIYYYTKYDSSTATGTLCRAEYGKLKEDSSKNDKYIETIASNISIGFEFLDDGIVIYTNGDGTLFCYDGKESTRIARDVNYYYTDGSKRVAYVTGDYDDGYTLYGVSLNDVENDIKLASNFSYICSAEDFDNILYVKDEDDYSQTLYVVGFQKDSERLGRDVYILSTLSGRVYFSMENGTILNLYDYVEDDNSLTDYHYAELRKELEDEKNGYPVRTLYCYADGKLTEIHDSVLNTMSYNGALMFNTVDLVTDKIRMKKVNSINDVKALFYVDYEACNYVVMTTGTDVYRMSESAADAHGEACDDGYGALYFSDDKEVYMGEADGQLSVAHISDGEIGAFQNIADDATVLDVDGSRLYFVRDVYERNYWNYGDLYVYEKGKESKLAKDILLDSVLCYADGVILANTDYRKDHGYELTMFDSQGKSTFIGEDVTQFIRVDKSTILYISDEDLYCYNGKESVRIKRDVDWLWSLNSMEVKRYLSYYGYYDGEQ